jgi:hypothetical protein
MSGAVEEAALHLFLKQIPPTDTWNQVDSDRCNFRSLMPALTHVSLLERYLVLEPRGNIRKRPSAHPLSMEESGPLMNVIGEIML